MYELFWQFNFPNTVQNFFLVPLVFKKNVWGEGLSFSDYKQMNLMAMKSNVLD